MFNFVINQDSFYTLYGILPKKNLRIDLYFTYISYHYRIRSMIKTTNWIERLNRDFKRTTRMRGALPNPEATLLLLGAVARDKKAYLRKVPKLDYEQNKFDWKNKGQFRFGYAFAPLTFIPKKKIINKYV